MSALLSIPGGRYSGDQESVITQSVEVGHLTLGQRGEMIGLDEGFCAIMRAKADAMIGRGILEFTAPEDRGACATGMATLRDTEKPVIVTKRMLRPDGSLFWVEQTTAIARFVGADPLILATIVPIATPESRFGPAALLHQARFLRESRADREDMFGSILFTNPSWDLLLKAYIAEAEGRTVDIAAMARTARITSAVALRWARALATDGLLEVEEGGIADAATPQYRLTAVAHERLERYLSQRLLKLTNLSVIA